MSFFIEVFVLSHESEQSFSKKGYRYKRTLETIQFYT